MALNLYEIHTSFFKVFEFQFSFFILQLYCKLLTKFYNSRSSIILNFDYTPNYKFKNKQDMARMPHKNMFLLISLKIK